MPSVLMVAENDGRPDHPHRRDSTPASRHCERASTAESCHDVSVASPHVNYERAAPEYAKRRTPTHDRLAIWGAAVARYVSDADLAVDLAAGAGGFSAALRDWGAAGSWRSSPARPCRPKRRQREACLWFEREQRRSRSGTTSQMSSGSQRPSITSRTRRPRQVNADEFSAAAAI